MTTKTTTEQPQYRASYRWVRAGRFGQRRAQRWFVKDATTGAVAREHALWSRADAIYEAATMNKTVPAAAGADVEDEASERGHIPALTRVKRSAYGRASERWACRLCGAWEELITYADGSARMRGEKLDALCWTNNRLAAAA